MAVAGLTRLRKHQFGRQEAIGTKVAATKQYNFKGVPSVNRNWTDPDIDAGNLAPVASPYLVAPDLTAPLTNAALRYNELPLLMTTFFGGDIDPTGSGTAKTWDFTIAGTAASEPDPCTYEFGDDVTDDWYQLGDGVAETVEISWPEGLGALSMSTTWRFGSFASSGSTDNAASPSVPTTLTQDLNEAIVYLKDGKIEIGSSVSGLAQVSDALHSFTLRLGGPLDIKRWANGTGTFDVQAYSRTMLDIQLECTFAKTEDIVGTGSESDAWMSNSAVNRIVRVTFTSGELAQTSGAIPYSWVFSMPMCYYTRTEGEVGGNTVVVLTGHAFYLPTDFAGVFKTTIVDTMTAAVRGA